MHAAFLKTSYRKRRGLSSFRREASTVNLLPKEGNNLKKRVLHMHVTNYLSAVFNLRVFYTCTCNYCLQNMYVLIANNYVTV